MIDIITFVENTPLKCSFASFETNRYIPVHAAYGLKPAINFKLN